MKPFIFEISVLPRLGQGFDESREAIENALFDLKDYQIEIHWGQLPPGAGVRGPRRVVVSNRRSQLLRLLRVDVGCDRARQSGDLRGLLE